MRSNIQVSNNQIILLLASGFTAKEIAQQLSIPHRTIEDRIHDMMKKNGARTRTQLVVKLMNAHHPALN